VQGTTPLAGLLAEIKPEVDVPVLAAGGIGDVNAARQAIALGADGLWLGTRFLASQESAAHPDYKRRLLEARATDTLLDLVFNIGWDDAPHRVIRNSTVLKWESSGRRSQGERPGEGDVVARFGDGRPIVRYEDVIPVEGMTGELESLALSPESVETIMEIPARGGTEQMSAAFPMSQLRSQASAS
jgi:NAD(P)H-dependent flavin oxidoreductase YrpB (nitropropane dioxygenase family)